jgi:iron complex outermembrane recepter protein
MEPRIMRSTRRNEGARRRARRACHLAVAALLCSTALVGAAPSARAQTGGAQTGAGRTFAFSIPPQSLASAIASFSRLSGLDVVGDGGIGRDLRSPGVSGTMTAPQALGHLLAGTGVGFRFTNASTVALEAARSTGSNAPATVAGAISLDTIDVQGVGQLLDTPPGTVGYLATQSVAGTKSNTPVIEVPQSISTVTRQQMNDRDVQTLEQALQYTPGVETNAFGYDPRFDAFSIRGFDVTYTGLYRDGLRQGGGAFAIPRIEPYGLQSVSVLRGPASGLYGLTSPGGIVDAITKRPPQDAFGEIQLQLGDYDRVQGNFDVGGPVPGNDKFFYRVTGLFRDSDTWQPGAKDNRDYIAPALTWKPDADTTITILTEYEKSLTSSNPSYYNGPNHQFFPIYSNDPAYGSLDQQQVRLGYEAEHRINEWVTVRQNFRVYGVDADMRYTQIDSIDPYAMTAQRSTGRVVDAYNNVSLDNQAEIHVATGPIAHNILLGVDYQHSYENEKIGFGAAPDLNLLTMNYGAQPIPEVTDFGYHVRQWQDETGVYAQEQAKLGGFLLTLNGQQSWVNETTDDLIAGSTAKQYNAAFTGRVGLSYLFSNGVTPYVSYATSFNPQVGTDSLGVAFKPTTGEQKEVGIKYQIPNMNVLLTAAAFDITQNNVLRVDPADIAFQSSTGQVESRGVELEATAALTQGLNLTAAYTHLNVKITQGAADTTGNAFSGIPNDTFAAFAKYTFQPGSWLAGLGIGLGARYLGSSFGDDENTFKNSPVTFVDAMMDYDFSKANPKLKGLKFQVNATNLFDVNHINCQSGYCYQDSPREVIGSLVYHW